MRGPPQLMNRNRFFGLLAGAAAATAVAVPAFADDGAEKADKAAKLEKALKGPQGEDAKRKIQELAQRIKARVGQGEVKSVNATAKSFVLTTKAGDVTVTTDANTTYHQGKERSL